MYSAVPENSASRKKSGATSFQQASAVPGLRKDLRPKIHATRAYDFYESIPRDHAPTPTAMAQKGQTRFTSRFQILHLQKLAGQSKMLINSSTHCLFDHRWRIWLARNRIFLPHRAPIPLQTPHDPKLTWQMTNSPHLRLLHMGTYHLAAQEIISAPQPLSHRK